MRLTLLSQLALSFTLASCFPILPLGAAQPSQAGSLYDLSACQEVIEVRSAAEMENLFRSLALQLHTGEVLFRLVGGWAYSVSDAVEQSNYVEWMKEFSTRPVTEDGVYALKGVAKDSARILGAFLNPELESRLSSRERAALKEARRWLKQLSRPGMSTLDKVQAVHDRIVESTSYTLKGADNGMASTLLLKGYGKCSAYSRTAWLLLQMMGIPCRQVLGNSGGPHEWNLVQIDGVWYHMDVTWDDPMAETQILRHDYFLIGDEQMARDHSWNRSKYPAAHDGPPLYFTSRELYFEEESDFWQAADRAYRRGEKSFVGYLVPFSTSAAFACEVNRRNMLPGHARVSSWRGPEKGSGAVYLYFVPRS